jgi:signal transduction histidine kinase
MHDQYDSSLNSSNALPFVRANPELECLTALSYRSGDLGDYLTEVVLGISRLLRTDWTIVTICIEGAGQVVASNLDLNPEDTIFSTHGTVMNVVVQTERSLIIEDRRLNPQYNQLPNEYLAYLGVPLRITTRETIGTICSFLREPRRFTEPEIKTVELFAKRAAIAIENYCLYQQQLRFNEKLSQDVAACSTHLKLSNEKLIERERLAAIGEFTAMIVHEVRNPLTTIEMGLRYAKKKLSSSDDQQRLELALSESRRLTHLLQEILHYSKPQVLKLSKVNISEYLDELVLQMQELPEASERFIHYAGGFAEGELMVDADKLRQVFLNLFRNAFEAIAPQETVSCKISSHNRANWISICIHNGGTPIPPELLPQLTTPFCSTKPSGTGLGLATSKQIVVAHGGELEIMSSSSGTTVSVHLPTLCSDI